MPTKTLTAVSRPLGREFETATTMEQWAEIGNSIYRDAESLQWVLADWAAFGEKHWGALKEFCEGHGMNYGTLRNYAFIATNVEMSRRRDNLSFGHHQEVAPLQPEQQTHWLTKASVNHWSVAELRRRIRTSETNSLSSTSDGPVLKYATKSALELSDFLTTRPSEFWNDSTRSYWRDRLKPIVEFYQERIAP